MTREEKLQEAMKVYRRLGRRTIAGGYPRDILFGQGDVVPKDIDVWISRQGRTIQQITKTAMEILARAGQELGRVVDGDERYGQGNVVFTSAGPSDIEPVEIIFHTGVGLDNVLRGFDINMCKCYIGDHGVSSNFEASLEYITGRINIQARPDMAKYSEHLKRVLLKYPHMKVVANLTMAFLAAPYQFLVNEGVINAPREILQAERQEPDRNEVGFQARGNHWVNAAIYNNVQWGEAGEVAGVGIPQRFN